MGKAHGPAVTINPGHIAYTYCFDNDDPDSIWAFQQYSSAQASSEFLESENYRAYVSEVEPLLSGRPQVTALTPIWSKSPTT